MNNKLQGLFLLITFTILLQSNNRVLSNEQYDYAYDYTIPTTDTKIPNKNTTATIKPPKTPFKSNKAVHSSPLSLHLFDDSLRQGLQPFYIITNFLIDDVFKPTIPESLLAPNSSIKDYLDRAVKGFKPNDFLSYWKTARQLLKSFGPISGLFIASLILALLITIIAICIFFKRCCCKPKSNPFDSKADSINRRLNAVVLFLFLLVALLATIILFFSNQNMHLVAEATAPNALKSSVRDLNGFLGSDVPHFFNRTDQQIDMIKADVSRLFDDSIVAFVSSKKPVKEFLSEFNTTLAPKLKDLSDSFNRIVPYLEIVEGFAKIFDNAEFNELVSNLRSEQVLNEMLNTTSILNLNTILSSLSNSKLWESEKNEIINDLVTQKLNTIKSQLHSVSDTVKSFNKAHFQSPEKSLANLDLKGLLHVYDYFYYVILAVSVFMLVIFLMHSCGLAGMCARRKHQNYKQCCHRGISANFLLASSSFYFLFAWVLIIVCIALYLPGMTVRQFACKPLIDLEHNDIFNVLKTQPELKKVNAIIKDVTQMDKLDIGKFNFSRMLIDCHLTNKSQQFADLFMQNAKSKMSGEQMVNVSQLFKSQRLQDSLPEKMKSFTKGLNQIRQVLNLETFKKVKTGITNALTLTNSLKDKANEISKIAPKIKESISSILVELNLVEKILDSKFLDAPDQETFKNLNLKLNEIESSLLDTTDMQSTLENFAQPRFEAILIDRATAVSESLPSCHILYSTYEKVVLTGCLQYVDNFNTFWVTLLFLVLLHFIIACLALCQADLFRKSYAYDELLADTEPMEPYKENINAGINDEHYEGHDGTKVSGAPIDAYEMHGYTKNNRNSAAQIHKVGSRGTPPPIYKVTRA